MSHAQLKERELRAAAMLIVSTAKHGTYLHDLQWLAFNCCIEAVAGARKTCDCCPPGTQGWQGHAAWVDPCRHCQSCCYRALLRSSFHRPSSVSCMPWNQMFVISDVCHPYVIHCPLLFAFNWHPGHAADDLTDVALAGLACGSDMSHMSRDHWDVRAISLKSTYIHRELAACASCCSYM